MAINKMHIVPFRRRRKGSTNYHKRLKLLVSNKLRVVVRKSLDNTIIQVVEYAPDGDRILASKSSTALKKAGWTMHRGNVPTAYLTGLMLGVELKQKNITSGILDIGIYPSTKGSTLYAAVKGLIDSGFTVPCNEKILPPEDRITGKHIEEYAKSLQNDQEKYKKVFSDYIKRGVDPTKFTQHFQEIKNKIMSEK